MKDDANRDAADRLVPLKQVANELGGISVRTIWRKVAAGQLPKPIRLGREAALFASDVSAYLWRLKTGRGMTERGPQ